MDRADSGVVHGLVLSLVGSLGGLRRGRRRIFLGV